MSSTTARNSTLKDESKQAAGRSVEALTTSTMTELDPILPLCYSVCRCVSSTRTHVKCVLGGLEELVHLEIELDALLYKHRRQHALPG